MTKIAMDHRLCTAAMDEGIKAAGLVLITPEGHALFLKRSEHGDHAGEWAFPGGGIEDGETPEDAAIREAREETGWIAPDEVDKPKAATSESGFVTLKQRIGNPFIPTLNNEHTAWAWAPLNDPPEPLHPGVKATLGQLAQDQMLTTTPNAGIPVGMTRRKAEDSIDGLKRIKRIDRSHDVRWMSELSKDGATFYGDESLPPEVNIKGKVFDPIEPLLRHEDAEFDEMIRLTEAFKAQHGREPNDGERKTIYLTAHKKAGNPAERRWIKENGIDWDAWEAWCRGKLSELENKEVKNPPPDPDVKPFKHERGEIEFAADRKVLAFDRSLRGDEKHQSAGRKGLAFDRESVRQFSKDGHLHVTKTPISKANVCPYYGYEIPDYEKLGLDPNKIYKLLRDPEELRKAAQTFNGKPLLAEHSPVTADDHDYQNVIGATGTDAEFEDPYLFNSLVVWPKEGIDPINSNEKKELSSAYHYRADMRPGIFRGERYDGVMRDIVGNHVALVEEGRAGADIVVGDSATSETKAENIMSGKPIILTRKAALLQGACMAFLKPKLAKDAKVDLAGILSKVTSKNLKQSKPKIAADIKKATEGKLAKDANIEGLIELIDALEGEAPAEAGTAGAMEAHPETGEPMEPAGAPVKAGMEGEEGEEEDAANPGEVDGSEHEKDEHEALKSYLAGKGMNEDEIAEACKLAGGGGMGGEDEGLEEDPNKKGEDEGLEEDPNKGAEDEPPPFKGKPEVGKGPGMGADKRTVTKQAMDTALAAAKKESDEAIKKAVDKAKAETRAENEKALKIATDAANDNARQIREAENEVRPWVGSIVVACDSALDVYRTALTSLGVKDIETIKDVAAMRAILKHVPLPGAAAKKDRIAVDHSSMSGFAERHPVAAQVRIGV